MDRKIALAKYIGCYLEDIKGQDDDWLFSIGGKEYVVYTDEEADEQTKLYILDSLWAFNSNFIIEHSKLPCEAEGMLKNFQTDLCEDANETIKALIVDLDEFVSDAIDADGRGHFLNSHDGEEIEIEVNNKTYFLYRMN
jgi:hypothetical protein